jgi:hypothetical protein
MLRFVLKSCKKNVIFKSFQYIVISVFLFFNYSKDYNYNFKKKSEYFLVTRLMSNLFTCSYYLLWMLLWVHFYQVSHNKFFFFLVWTCKLNWCWILWMNFHSVHFNVLTNPCGKVWNECNQYGIPKSMLKCFQSLFLLLNRFFEIHPKNNQWHIYGNFVKYNVT